MLLAIVVIWLVISIAVAFILARASVKTVAWVLGVDHED